MSLVVGEPTTHYPYHQMPRVGFDPTLYRTLPTRRIENSFNPTNEIRREIRKLRTQIDRGYDFGNRIVFNNCFVAPGPDALDKLAI